MIYIFDYEVFAHDWVLVAKQIASSDFLIFHNDNDGVKEFMENEPWLGGFNNKHYDQFIHKAILNDATPEQVKEINDFIIVGGNQGWEHPFIKDCDVYFDQFDLMDDCQQGLSLKSIEAHLGMNITESSVDFTLNRPLNEEELREVIEYCKRDVEATEILFNLRRNYLKSKLFVGELKGISDKKSLYMTNAKLTAAYLDAHKEEHTDERDYEYPDNLDRNYIPSIMFDFFNRLKDKSIPDEEVFEGKCNFKIGECVITVGYGGVHGAIPTYHEESTEDRKIRNRDVGSYYPHEMTIDGYCSRNIASAELYSNMLETRMKAKKKGDKATANALKLVANTTYGAMLNKYNELYDARMGRSVCITGQLRLVELAEHLYMDCESLKVIQINTDGIMVSLDNEDLDRYDEICQEWQDRTGFELEEDCIREIIQKDVNNYVEIAESGDTKLKGGLLVRGITNNDNLNLLEYGIPKQWEQITGGAFNINNNAVIIAKAIADYFIHGIPAATTINNCEDILEFQIIAKASSKYAGVYHDIESEFAPVQRCNRVYAIANTLYGTLYKVHKESGSYVKIAGLPIHCVVDNKNELSLDVVDKKWYIRQAEKYINDFMGVNAPRINKRRINKLKKECLAMLEV